MTLVVIAAQAKTKPYVLTSPNGKIRVEIHAGQTITYSLYDDGKCLMQDNAIGLTTSTTTSAGRRSTALTEKPVIRKARSSKATEHIQAPFYRTASFDVSYQALALELKSGLTIEFRAFDDGIAYRHVIGHPKTNGSQQTGEDYTIDSETAEFRFTADHVAYLPYSTNPKKPMAMAFQATYSKKKLSEQRNDNLAFLPATIDCGSAKLTIMESDVENYPGMFVRPDRTTLKAEFASAPKTFDYYAWRKQKYVTSTENYLARCSGDRTLPWRIVAIAHEDCEMPTNNLVYALASPSRVKDTSWIKPGLVAWDWWNNWGLSKVDFKAGINNATYKYYIDFAAQYHLPYVILDEGWYAPRSGDMLTTISDIDLAELAAYARERRVRLILWTVFNVLDDQLEAACEKYAAMGIAGFKVDFLDRDDAEASQMIHRIAEACARHQLLLDYHGISKPTGINRTWPNIVNYESCFGMEEAKWTKPGEQDMPLYDVTFPFIRMQTGFVDFTPGGMRNAAKADFQPIYNNPLTMGTRCHQLAMYIVHDSPLTMLADNPTSYQQEPDYTSVLSSLPTTFDETRILSGKLGEYIVTMRRSGRNYYIAGQTNWDARSLDLSFDFLPKGKSYQAKFLTDGPNAETVATDYAVRTSTLDAASTETVRLASGGGFLILLQEQ